MSAVGRLESNGGFRGVINAPLRRRRCTARDERIQDDRSAIRRRCPSSSGFPRAIVKYKGQDATLSLGSPFRMRRTTEFMKSDDFCH